MQVVARVCGHASLSEFRATDLTKWKRETADLSGLRFVGVSG